MKTQCQNQINIGVSKANDSVDTLTKYNKYWCNTGESDKCKHNIKID